MSTIRNISELEKALESSFPRRTNSPLSQPPQDSPRSISPTTIWPIQTSSHITNGTNSNSPTPSSKDRTSTYQSSTNQLLINLAGLQTTTNTKLDLLTDAILRQTKTLEEILNENRKHTELLARIMSNTAEPRFIQDKSSDGSASNKSTKQTTHKCKDYGFTNNVQVVSEFIMAILKQAEIHIKSRGKGYRSSRTMERLMLDKAVKLLADSDYKTSGSRKAKVNIPATNSDPCIYLASKIGSTDSVKPILTPQAILQLFGDPNCRPMISAVDEIMSRLKVIRWMIPYYEADIIDSLLHPYFDEDGHVLCDWSKLNPRSESPIESKIFCAKVERREMLGKLILNGSSFEKAFKLAIERT